MNHTQCNWSQFPPLPDAEGFATPFAGVAGGALLIAGGANFPNKRPWEGGTKIWYDRVFILPTAKSAWIEAGHLPRPNAYGIAVSVPSGVICAGGGDSREHFRDVFLLSWDGQTLRTSALASLPKTCAFGSGALTCNTFYIAGGIEKPDSANAMNAFWALDVEGKSPSAWRELPPCPGPARMLAVAGGHDGVFYLFGGVSLNTGSDGKPQRTPLLDAYAYNPKSGWRRLSDLPRPATAAASPAPVSDGGKLFVISGDDGKRSHLNGPNHPGFPRDILVYDPVNDRWSTEGEAPISRATAPTAFWSGRWVIASGERKPGYRSPEVWSFDIQP